MLWLGKLSRKWYNCMRARKLLDRKFIHRKIAYCGEHPQPPHDGIPRMVPASIVRILALGSPHGDDQVAWRVADRLCRDPIYLDVVFSLDSPYQLLAHFAPDRPTIIIDACQTGMRPGTIVSVCENRLGSLRTGGVSSHGGSVGDVIRLAEALGRKPTNLKILAVELGACDPAGEMSAAVLSSIEPLEQQVRQEIMGFEPEQIMNNA